MEPRPRGRSGEGPTAFLPYCLIALLPYCLTALLPYCLLLSRRTAGFPLRIRRHVDGGPLGLGKTLGPSGLLGRWDRPGCPPGSVFPGRRCRRPSNRPGPVERRHRRLSSDGRRPGRLGRRAPTREAHVPVGPETGGWLFVGGHRLLRGDHRGRIGPPGLYGQRHGRRVDGRCGGPLGGAGRCLPHRRSGARHRPLGRPGRPRAEAPTGRPAGESMGRPRADRAGLPAGRPAGI
jgi:hypothetical protein